MGLESSAPPRNGAGLGAERILILVFSTLPTTACKQPPRSPAGTKREQPGALVETGALRFGEEKSEAVAPSKVSQTECRATLTRSTSRRLRK